ALGARGDIDAPLCPGHNEECVLRTTRKEGPNQGRQFYCCPRPDRSEQCSIFVWLDEADGVGGGRGGSDRRPGQGFGGGEGDGRVCTGHQEACALRTVRKEGPNQGRQFYCCARQESDGRCSTFMWADEDPPAAGGAGGADGRLCEGHQEPCSFRTVRKEGDNRGRQFYACPRPQGEQCGTFQWADEDRPDPAGVSSERGRFTGGGQGRNNSRSPSSQGGGRGRSRASRGGLFGAAGASG
ncbi:unnamed protein product, partial [Ascophyllum nodosum]